MWVRRCWASVSTHICTKCGKPGSVPFRPDNSRPVHCELCYDKTHEESGRKRRVFLRT
ncbi:MAG: CxxC-x17-CxxC domain-containing protein [Candidatus Bathyarchaeia archaeon]